MHSTTFNRMQEWAIAAAEYKPNARHILRINMPDPGEALVTATSGIFRDLGAHLGEKPNDQSGTLCDGTRYNVLAKRRSILLVWTGPADNEGVVGFRITAASSALSGFSQSSAHFTPNRDLHPPAHVPIAASGADGGGAERYLRYTKIVIHGWLSSIAWLVMIPAGMWAARYAKLPPHVAPESIHRSSVTSSIRLAWLKLHIWLNAIGLAFAFTGALHSYSALHTLPGTGNHMQSTHSFFGVATLLLGLSQPINAYTRPNAPRAGEESSTPRIRWEMLHRSTALLSLLFAIVSVDSGIGEAKGWGSSEKTADVARGGYRLWLLAAILATAVLEFVRRHGRSRSEEVGTGTEFDVLMEDQQD